MGKNRLKGWSFMGLISRCLDINKHNRLTIGGVDIAELAEQYGTPAYIMDEDDIRTNCREFMDSMRAFYDGEFSVAYASKALSCVYMYNIMKEEGLGADVVSGGELYTALKAGLPPEKIIFHGNNKSDFEIKYALESSVGRIVVDNREELYRVNSFAAQLGKKADISFRLKPGIDAHTHEFIRTGKIDSKFGFAMENDEAFQFVKEVIQFENLRLAGIHCHIGSQIFDSEPFELAVKVLMGFIKRVKEELGYSIEELNLGGGFGIRYIESHDPRSIPDIVKTTAEAVKSCSESMSLKPPRLVLEPGRSITGASGITVYTVGCVKHIPGVRTYVMVDGGMTDNPRFALYGAVYTAVLPERPVQQPTELVTIAGRCCESGDLIARDILLPPVKRGDLLAILATGAYNYSMASNYNRIPRPPIVMVSAGTPKLAVRRESYEDLVRNDF